MFLSPWHVGVSVELDFWLGQWTEEASRWNETKLGEKTSEEAMQEFVRRTVSGHDFMDVTAIVLWLVLSAIVGS